MFFSYYFLGGGADFGIPILTEFCVSFRSKRKKYSTVKHNRFFLLMFLLLCFLVVVVVVVVVQH